MDPIMVGAAVTANALAVVALWLHLRWHVRREQTRGRTLTELAGALRAGGELDEQLPDGSRLKLTVARAGGEPNQHG